MLTQTVARLRGDRQLLLGALVGAGMGFLILYRAWDGAGSLERFTQVTLVGLSAGSVLALSASGLVLTYTTTGVFNFAHGAVGMVAAFMYFELTEESGLPAPLAIAIVLLVGAPVVGLLLERILRSFRGASPGTTLTVTIAITILLIGAIQYFFPAEGAEQRTADYLFGDRFVTIAGARLRWDAVAYAIVAAVAAVGLRYLLKVTRTGVAMRAVVDNPDLAGLTGAPPITIARTSWVLGTFLAAVAGILYAPTVAPLEPINLTFFVLAAYGAAVFGRLRSLPLTYLGALVLGLVQGYAPSSFPRTELWNHLQVGIPGIFLFLVLMALPEAKLTVGRLVGREVPRVPRFNKTVLVGALFVPVAWLIGRASGDYHVDVNRGLIYATLIMSLVLLTGYSGQISLAQYVFYGLGAFAMGEVAGGDSILGLGAAALIAVPLGIVIALPAMRLQGLYLALVTFALAQVGEAVIFQDTRIYGQGSITVGRLEFLGVSFRSDEAFTVLCALVFVLVAIGVLALRRGPFGRRLSAMRDSQAACATLGMDVRRTKLAVFVLSASIAGLAGALHGGLGFVASQTEFPPLLNILLFLFAYVGGITTATGALLGGALFSALPLVQSEFPEYAGLVFAAIAITALALGKQPNGMAGLLYTFTGWVKRSWRGGGSLPAAGATASSHASPSEVADAMA